MVPTLRIVQESKVMLSLTNLVTLALHTGPFLHASHSVQTKKHKDEEGTAQDPRKYSWLDTACT